MHTTPISSIEIDGREFLVKRDELVNPFLAGNKYRKLYQLLKNPPKNIKTIISYGGTQSNAMLAIAKMCFDNNWEFKYYSKKLSNFQKNQNEGNYYEALKLGMNHIEIPHSIYKNFISSLNINQNLDTYIIHQGGANTIAKQGLKVLADEITAQNPQTNFLATPSGTGTTALYLAINLPEYIVYTTPVIGDTDYLKTQMLSLEGYIPKNLIILNPDKKYPFAKPNKEFLKIYTKLKEAGIEIDLLYAPLMWKMLFEKTNDKILYIHSGGITGNKSMLKRYEQKNLINIY